MLLFCRACLAMDVKLVELKEYYLDTVYRNIIQKSIAVTKGVPEVMCVECAIRLLNGQKFREKCLKSNLILRDLMRSYNKLSREHIQSVDRRALNLLSNLNMSQPESKRDIVHIEYDDSDFNRENYKIENPELMLIVKSETAIDTYETRNKPPEGFNEQKYNMNGQNIIDVDNEKYDISDNDDRLDGDNVSDDDKNDIGDFFEDNDEFIVEGYCDEAVKESDSSSDSDDDIQLKNAKLKRVQILINKNTESSTDKGLKGEEVGKRKTETNIETEKVDLRRIPIVPVGDGLSTLLTVRKLSFEEQVQEILKRKDSESYRTSRHKCDICFKGFSVKSAIAMHMLRHGDLYGKHECNVCHLRFRSANTARKHTTASHVQMYSCTECPYYTTRRDAAKVHVSWHKGKKYKCKHCGEEFVKPTTYMGHLRIRHASNYICELCGFAFVSLKGLYLHKRLKHPIAQAVPDDGPFCQECNVRFLSAAAYNKHFKESSRHPEKKRPLGEYKPRETYSRERDIKHVYLPNEEVTCEQCGVKVSSPRDYYTHFRNAHPDKNRTFYPAIKRPSMCEVCGKIFQSLALLRDHSHSHSSAPLFQCAQCHKAFRMKQRLVSHMHVHSAERTRHACHECGKNFSSDANRRRHAATHTGLRPFKCEMCYKSFTTQSAKKSHVNYVHFKKPWPKRNRRKQKAGAKQGQQMPQVAVRAIQTRTSGRPATKLV